MNMYIAIFLILCVSLLLSCGSKEPLTQIDIQLNAENACAELAEDFFSNVKNDDLAGASRLTVTESIDATWIELPDFSVEEITAMSHNDSIVLVRVKLLIDTREVSEEFQCQLINNEWKLDIQ